MCSLSHTWCFVFFVHVSGGRETFMDPALLDNLREHHVSILSSYIVNYHITDVQFNPANSNPQGKQKTVQVSGDSS